MRIVLFLLCVLAFLAGASIFAAAESAVHEIEGFILFLISAVLLAGASIVEAINGARKRIESLIRQAPPPTSPTRSPSVLPAQLVTSMPQPTRPAVEVSSNGVEMSRWNDQELTEDDANALMDQARQIIHSGDRKKAIAALKEIIRRYPRMQAADKARRSLEQSGISI